MMDVAAAVVYAADNGANVINMSFGDPRISPILRDAVRYAAARGCILVAAAGNEGTGRISLPTEPMIFYPAAYDEVIAVGATNSDDELSPTSSYGAGLDLVAPGVGILSTYLNGTYQPLSGTSMAAPHVAGGG